MHTPSPAIWCISTSRSSGASPTVVGTARLAVRPVGAMGCSYLHHAVDDHSPLAYSEILGDETEESAAAFWLRANAFFTSHSVTVSRVLTDNGSCYRSQLFAELSAPSRTSGPGHAGHRPSGKSSDLTAHLPPGGGMDATRSIVLGSSRQGQDGTRRPEWCERPYHRGLTCCLRYESSSLPERTCRKSLILSACRCSDLGIVISVAVSEFR